MSEDDDGLERRQAVRDRLWRVENSLTRHVTECAAMQKRVLMGIIGLFGWVVIHSPEVVGFFAKVAARSP